MIPAVLSKLTDGRTVEVVRLDHERILAAVYGLKDGHADGLDEVRVYTDTEVARLVDAHTDRLFGEIIRRL